MRKLNLPRYDFTIEMREGGRQFIVDPVRQKRVLLTPEEWVRQHIVQYLIRYRGVPRSLIAIEESFSFEGMYYRADVVVYKRNVVYKREMQPMLIVECKRPSIKLSQEVFDQIGVYNSVIPARYLVVTNGYEHYCCRVDHSRKTVEYLKEIPMYTAMM